MCGTLRSLAAVVMLGLVGCAGQPGPGGGLEPADFAALPEGESEGNPGSGSMGVRDLGRPQPLDAGDFAATDAVLVPAPVDAAALPLVGPQPEVSPPERTRPGVVLLDVKVGEVNNKPIFAAEFLDPLAQRLRALAYEDVDLSGGGTRAELVPLPVWRSQAGAIINEQLEIFITNELVIAEGLASFTPAQRSSLRNFLGLAREDLERQSGGSITRAVRNLGTGQTLSEYLQEVRNRQLISRFSDDLRRSVVVTRSDVERAYLQRYGSDRKPSSMTFREIRVPRDDAEAAARVSRRLSRGEPFAEVATDEANTSRRSDGGLWPAMSFTGEFADATFFPSDPDLDEALRGLTPGEWAGPIESDRFTHWIYLNDISIGYKTWAEAQSELRLELYNQRLEEAYQREMARLFQQAGLQDRAAMRDELLTVATRWYYPDQ
ncbi:MAG: peptidylprolyl isomerase [Phycisphaerales bacterium JB060]